MSRFTTTDITELSTEDRLDLLQNKLSGMSKDDPKYARYNNAYYYLLGKELEQEQAEYREYRAAFREYVLE